MATHALEADEQGGGGSLPDPSSSLGRLAAPSQPRSRPQTNAPPVGGGGVCREQSLCSWPSRPEHTNKGESLGAAADRHAPRSGRRHGGRGAGSWGAVAGRPQPRGSPAGTCLFTKVKAHQTAASFRRLSSEDHGVPSSGFCPPLPAPHPSSWPPA